jgi:translation initiation factor 6
MRISYFRNPFIGLFGVANDKLCLLPIDASNKLEQHIADAIKVDVKRTIVASSNLIGLYTAMNNKGLVLPNNIGDEELKKIKEIGEEYGFVVDKIDVSLNAWGNNIVLNNKAGFYNPLLPKQVVKRLEDVFDVELVEWRIEPFKTPGSIMCVNDYGALVHHIIKEEHLKEIRDVMKLKEIERGTINKGVGFIGYGALSNNNGVVVGEQSTGFEVGVLLSTLGFVDEVVK